ncbi:MAG: hypothetical protein SFU57_13345 [Gemmatimonadales bacterium]|nr:hypothetical protein [Gemmatimonadales bacterium]
MINHAAFPRVFSRLCCLATFAVVAVGCDHRGTEFLAQKLSDGRDLVELLEEAPGGMVILVSPGQCLTCDSRLRKVFASYPSPLPPIPVVFTRPPTKFELRRFVLEGIPRGLPFVADSLASEVTEPIAIVHRERRPARVLRLVEADAMLRKIFLSAADSAQNSQ